MAPTEERCAAPSGEGMAMRDYLNNLAVMAATACPLWIRNNSFSRDAAKNAVQGASPGCKWNMGKPPQG